MTIYGGVKKFLVEPEGIESMIMKSLGEIAGPEFGFDGKESLGPVSKMEWLKYVD